MIGDKETDFFYEEEVHASCVSKAIKVGANGKGAGSRMVGKLGSYIRCVESYDSITSMTVELVESNDQASWEPVKGFSSMVFDTDDLVLGGIDVNSPLPNSQQDYIALRVTVVGTPTTGKISAGITPSNTCR